MKLLFIRKSFMYHHLLLFILLLTHCTKSKIQIPATKDSITVSASSANVPPPASDVPLKNMFGVNVYEWNFLSNPADVNNRTTIYEANMSLIKSFSAIRHYLDWNKLEYTEGNYTYAPTHDGSWDYDLIYTRCKQEGITTLIDIKNCPNWLMQTYPSSLQDIENVPAPYGADLSKPASYVQQARVAFQVAARYGYNTAVNPALVKVDTRPRWTNDQINVVKIGLGLVKYIECDNERDKWWKGPQTQQTPEQYAANMSAFYDGDKGKLGSNAGVKTADPNMLVVMGGLASCDTNFVKRMIDWCRVNRGVKADGTVNLCFDIINYHYYSNDGSVNPRTAATTGVAPELSEAGMLAAAFMKVGKANHVPVWVTEAGYDINQGSYQKAIAIGSKSVALTQADWILRTALLYMRHGIQNLFYYQLFDDTPGSPTQYATSGLAEGTKRRPAADYILQATKLLGNYNYSKTINADPLVDVYVSGKKVMYVLTVPDQKGRAALYSLDLGEKTLSTNVYKPTPGADAMTKTVGIPVAGKLNVTATETPIFIEAGN
ncbi:hypothetical protein [Mucilaginibacter boryungensis]|nr:hypothetical protein [Mucilaginibacter boryungensis]